MPEPMAGEGGPPGAASPEPQHILNADAQRLFCRYWGPETLPRALVFVVHGVAEHCGRYNQLAEILAQQGLLIFAHDHVGHGRSEGPRCKVRDFQVFIRDSLQHIDLMRTRHPNLPVFLLGHSMGGAVSILTACERPSEFAGVVLIAPMVQMDPQSATPLKVFAAKILNHVLPNLTLGSVDSRWMSRDTKEVEAYEADELVYHGGLCVSFGMQLLSAEQRIKSAIAGIAWPFLLLHGDADRLCDIKGSQTMLENAQSGDKKLTVYNGAYHSLHHELPETTASVLKEIKEWIVGRIPAQEAPL